MTKPPALANYSVVETEDGSQTLFSERFQEACHSPSGAKAETILHYLKGCKVHQRAAEARVFTVLEVGFGTGLGLITTIEELADLQTQIHFVSLEIDENLVKWVLSQELQSFTPEWIHDGQFSRVEGKKGNFKFTLLIGNARKTIPNYMQHFPVKWDAIYQDAFSPGRNPVLWTKEWFELLKSNSSSDVILSTYSASNSIRKSMVEAGWKVYAGEKFGQKRASTRARLAGDSDTDILDLLNRSPAKAIVDADLTGELFE